MNIYKPGVFASTLFGSATNHWGCITDQYSSFVSGLAISAKGLDIAYIIESVSISGIKITHFQSWG